MENQTRIHFEKTLKGFSYNVIGVILPFILSLIPIFVLGKYNAIWTFLDQGQFLLFGAGLYTTSIFLFGENQASIRHDIDKILNNISVWFLIICSSFYAIIYCLDLIKHDALSINTSFIRWTSVLLFFVSIISVYRSLFIDFLKTYPDVDIKEESKKGVDNILKEL
ncbi:hypothetical protein Cpar_0380 [Chlorobaculum parvum NCIB 8327]|uniref:Uncharacterized protein n=1 Tax=Chlorobaculum parvum (strain DSM 263 / NCIMB 8327) TaxID=517417 RepID=B3QL15_CHLP8|nr:hypothetical protein [Chlorobaculum parvum]ACF10803.1 hypothetical protein Cpar_0380 [Chlorobaculum parvum NCIB 8327]